MIVDTSAILAILLSEKEADDFAECLLEVGHCRTSAVSFVEASIIAESRGGDGSVRQLDALMKKIGIAIEPVSEEQALAARQAFSDFGKGRHPAGLNLGDCFSYALAKVAGEPLLFKGNDFRKTDIFPGNG
ncbi:MAG TPA: type II toxin-antitoxin system VapC family toxin [Candidatus Acidoferrum sp.]|nr:type II toxin-antitoxin system VapC family toxin [Candidatus Acidoferrum sp.]